LQPLRDCGNGSEIGVGVTGDVPAHDAAGIVRDLEAVEESRVPVHSTSGTGRRLAIGILVLGVALCLGFWYAHHRNAIAAEALAHEANEAAQAAAPVDVVRVSYSSPNASLELPGETRGWYQSTIYARVNGYVGKWWADIGDRVTKGQVLATIETPELDEQLNAAKAQVNADQADVKVAEANQNFAQVNNTRFQDSPPGVVAEEERDKAKADFQAAGARLHSAKARVALDEAQVKRLTSIKNFQKVVAPYDGIITARRIDIGDLVTAGSTTNTTPLYDMTQSDRIRIYVDVPQSASTEIHDKMPAVATADEYPGRNFTGEVARNSSAIDPNAKTLRVEVDIQNSDLTLKPGMYVQVGFQTSTVHPLVEIPAAALTFRTGGPEVAVVDANGVVHFRPVTIARDMGSVVELTSGLSAGDMVALNISNQISDGDKVQANVENDSTHPSPSTPHLAAR
jgi:RND family efflux transporter MFP subunit